MNWFSLADGGLRVIQAAVGSSMFWVFLLAVATAKRYRTQLDQLFEKAVKLLDRRISITRGEITLAIETQAARQEEPPPQGLAGVPEVARPPAAQALPPAGAEGPNVAVERFLARWTGPYLAAQEPQLIAFFEQNGVNDIRAEAARSPVVRAILRFATVAGTDLDFERIFSIIFEAQIRVLRTLNAFGVVRRDQLLPLYEGLARANEYFRANSTFETFVGFLVNQGLVERQDGLPAEQYLITEKGRSFLGFLERWRKPPKPY